MHFCNGFQMGREISFALYFSRIKGGNPPPGLVSEFVNLCRILTPHIIASTQMQLISRIFRKYKAWVKAATVPQVWSVSLWICVKYWNNTVLHRLRCNGFQGIQFPGAFSRVKGAILPQVWPVSEQLLWGDETRTRRPPQASHSSHPSPRPYTKCGR